MPRAIQRPEKPVSHDQGDEHLLHSVRNNGYWSSCCAVVGTTYRRLVCTVTDLFDDYYHNHAVAVACGLLLGFGSGVFTYTILCPVRGPTDYPNLSTVERLEFELSQVKNHNRILAKSLPGGTPFPADDVYISSPEHAARGRLWKEAVDITLRERAKADEQKTTPNHFPVLEAREAGEPPKS